MAFNFPDEPSEEELRDNIFSILKSFESDFSNRYSEKIEPRITTVTIFNGERDVLQYAFWLKFKTTNYTYRFFELVSTNSSGSYPVEVTAYVSPPKPFGTANNAEQLKESLQRILSDERTKMTLFSHY